MACPHCGDLYPGFHTTCSIWKCRNKPYREQFCAKAGTVFEYAPIAPGKWFVSLWLCVNAKNRISSLGLHRAIGVTQKIAWFMLHRLCMVLGEDEPEAEDDKLSGTVVVDETFIGGKGENVHSHRHKLVIQGPGPVGKAIVLGILERHTDNKKKGATKVQSTRVRAKVVVNRQAETLQSEIRALIARDFTHYTDEHASYARMEEYVHDTVSHLEEYVRRAVHTYGC